MWGRKRMGTFHSTKSSNFTKSRHLASVCRDLSLSRPCAPIACVCDRSHPHPCFYPRENSACHFLSGNFIFTLGFWDTLVHLFSTPDLNSVSSVHISLNWINAFLVHSWSAWLHSNPERDFQETGVWETLLIQELCLYMWWNVAWVYSGVYSEWGGQEGPFPRHRASQLLGGSPRRESCAANKQRDCALPWWENYPSRRQENL